jgi:hypothetical protein
MKKLTSYLFLLLYVPVSFNFFLPVVAYSLNLQFIAEELCENKDKPELMCKGKCYLGEQMEKQTGTSSKQHNKIILTNTHDLPHLIINNDKSLNNFPRIISYSLYYQYTIDKEEEVHTPPPKLV